MNMFDEFAAQRRASGQSTAHVNMFDEFAATRAKNSSPRISSDYNKLFGTSLNPNPQKTDSAQMGNIIATARKIPVVQPVKAPTLADDHAFRQKAINDPNTNFLLKKWLQVIDPVVSNPTYNAFSQRSGAAASSAMGGNQIQAPSTGNVFADAGADALGMVGGIMAAPGAGQAMGVENVLGGLASKYAPTIGRLAPKLVGTTAGKLAGKALQGAGGGTAYEGTLGVVNGQSPAEIAKRMGTGAATFGILKGAGALGKLPAAAAGAGVFGGQAALSGGTPTEVAANAFFGAGMGALGGENRKVQEPVSPLKMSDINRVYGPENPNRITMDRPGQRPLPKMAGTNTLAPSLKPVTGANGGQAFAPQPLATNEPRISGGIQPLSGNPDTGGGAVKERQFSQSVQGSSIAPADIKQGLADNKLTYEPITNKATFDKATQLVNSDPVQAQNYFNSPSKGVSADDVALGEALITKAIKEGNTPEANRLIADLAEKLTTAGQAVQAASIFKKLTPEGMLLYAQRVVNSANKDLIGRMGKKAEKILLTAEDSDFILNTMKEAQTLPDGREKDVAMAKVMQLIANKVPATSSEKWAGVQRLSMLLNPKTMNRNFLGNTLFGGVDNLSNIVGTPLDKAVGLMTGKRTTALPSLTGQLKSGAQGVKYTLQDAKLGIDTGNGTQFDLPNKRIFRNKILNTLDKVTKVGLQLGDRPFYKAAYDDSLRQQMKLNKVTEPTQEMIDQANKTAQQRTYQDTNGLTDAFKTAQKALNKVSAHLGLSSKEFGLGNIVLPFVKTPANILARAVEYSPMGITKALREATNISKGTFDQKVFVDAISRAVTGTAIIMVGYDLAKQGKITGSGNADKDVAAFERGLGKNDYAYKVGDNYYTYDWMQPASMALAIGADMYLKGKDRKQAENVVFDAVKSGGETLFKQTVLQGLSRFMGGYSPMDNLATTAINAPSQFAPTLGKQITQLTDPIQRSTYSPSNLGTGANLIKAKIPGVSKSLEPKIDTFGNTVKSYQGDNSLFNIFVNPGSSTEFKPNKVQKEILRLYDATGDKTIFPKVAPKYFTEKGQRYDLTPQEVTTYQQVMGKNTENRMASIIAYPYPDKVMTTTLVRAIKLSEEDARKAILSKRKAGD